MMSPRSINRSYSRDKLRTARLQARIGAPASSLPCRTEASALRKRAGWHRGFQRAGRWLSNSKKAVPKCAAKTS
jgi:hypothetical protein